MPRPDSINESLLKDGINRVVLKEPVGTTSMVSSGPVYIVQAA